MRRAIARCTAGSVGLVVIMAAGVVMDVSQSHSDETIHG
jgi:hypothetical protein